MKKFFALVLAVAMVMSLAAVSFAAPTPEAVVKLVGPLKYDADKNAMACTTNIPALGLTQDDKEINCYGEPVYFLAISDNDITDNGGTITLAPVTKYSHVEKLKYKVEIEMGVQILRGISIVKKYVDVDAKWDDDATPYQLADSGIIPESGYYYFAEVLIADSNSIAETDVSGKVELSRKADSKKGINKMDKDKNTLDFDFTVFHQNNWQGAGSPYLVKDSVTLEYDEVYALKFDCDDEVEIEFGTEPNEGTFTVDASGQGKIVFKFDTAANEAIADANPNAKMFFVNFNGAKFNRVGEFEYEMEDMAAAYEIVDGKLKAIPGLKIESDTATFNTRTLGSYVFATAELVDPAPAAATVA